MNKRNTKIYKIFLACLIILASFTVSVSAYSRELIPCGMTVGISAKIKGVCVIDTVDYVNKNGKTVSPAKDAGIEPGDYIVSLNSKPVLSSADLSSLIIKNYQGISVEVTRNGERKKFEIFPEETSNEGYKLGVRVKDYESGIGTITYIDPGSKEFGALGHGICHTESILTDIDGGSVIDVDLTSIKKGERGAPGELIGIFTESNEFLGAVSKNKHTGVYGSATNELMNLIGEPSIEIAERCDVKEGDITILSNIEGNDIKEYSAKITKINDDEKNTKGMIVKITDKELLEKTGGIVQGMSGSPIIQNGKLVGAVTHVFVNDPTRGYGIFIENMLSEAEKIK